MWSDLLYKFYSCSCGEDRLKGGRTLQKSRAVRKKCVSNIFFSLSIMVLGNEVSGASKMDKNGNMRAT